MARSEQSQYRKTQRMIENSHGGFHGRSILEQITDELDKAMDRYLGLKELGPGAALQTARGEVRGLARALLIFAVPTYPSIKAVERASLRRVKEKRNAEERAAKEEELEGRG